MHYRDSIFLTCVLMLLSGSVFAEDAEVATTTTEEGSNTAVEAERWVGPLHHPEGPGYERWRFAVGGLLDIVPSQLIEAGPPTIPRATFDLRYGIGHGFSFVGNFNTQLISNELTAGVGWSAAGDRWSFMTGLGVGGYLGMLGSFGLESKVGGGILKPYIRFGYALRELRVTLATEGWLYTGQYTRIGDQGYKTGFVPAATQTSISFETYFEDGSMFWLSAGAMFADVDFAIWALMSDEDQRLLYPRFAASYEF